MTPETFWGCSVKEFVTSMDGYMITKGRNKTLQPVLKEEMEELMRRFPD